MTKRVLVRKPHTRSENRKCIYCGGPITNHNGRGTAFCGVVCQILKRTGGVGDPNGCWVWQGPKNKKNGVGAVVVRQPGQKRGRSQRVGRAMYIAEFGQPPADHDVVEMCGTRNCVNPKHLTTRHHAEWCRKGLPVLNSRRARSRKTEEQSV